ncbi:PepSY domain-containing protein [Streptomyces sp. NPDC003300]|uniref:PepSY domain-containing protein n=1 Tax=unclassified Streptomyces TaxID=2593676 RepID=UPI0033AF06E6
MKRNITVAAVAAAALLAGGGYTAIAAGDDHGGRATAVPSATSPHDAGDDHGGDRRTPSTGAPTGVPRTGAPTPSSTGLTAAEAVTAALTLYPGTVVSVERSGADFWEVRVLGKDGVLRELRVNATSGTVSLDGHRGGGRGAATPRPTRSPGGDDHGGGTPSPTRSPGADDHGGDRSGDGHGSGHGADDGGQHRGRGGDDS